MANLFLIMLIYHEQPMVKVEYSQKDDRNRSHFLQSPIKSVIE